MKKQEVLAHLCAEMKARNLGVDFGTMEPKWTERHYTVEEVATMWGLSNDTITRIFVSFRQACVRPASLAC